MPIEPINLTSLVATVLGISIVLIPVIGITARFALKPTVEALSRLFENRSTNEIVGMLERRLELQEQEIAMLRHQIGSLSEGHDFDRQLSGPGAAGGSKVGPA